jgi:hypothetical protein
MAEVDKITLLLLGTIIVLISCLGLFIESRFDELTHKLALLSSEKLRQDGAKWRPR